MDIAELIWFLVASVVLIMSSARRSREERRAKEKKEKGHDVRQVREEVLHYLETGELPASAPKKRAKPQRTVTKDYALHPELETVESPATIEERALHSKLEEVSGQNLVADHFQGSGQVQQGKRQPSSKVKKLLKGQQKLKQMMVIDAVLGAPKGWPQ